MSFGGFEFDTYSIWLPPGVVRRPVADVPRRARPRSAASAAAAPLAAAGAARILNRFRLSSEEQRRVPLLIEPHHHRRIFVDDPEVVLRIDADLRCEEEPV